AASARHERNVRTRRADGYSVPAARPFLRRSVVSELVRQESVPHVGVRGPGKPWAAIRLSRGRSVRSGFDQGLRSGSATREIVGAELLDRVPVLEDPLEDDLVADASYGELASVV